MPKRSKSDKQRDEFYAVHVNVMSVTAGNFDHAVGEQAAILTVARGLEIEQPMAMRLRDARMVVAKLLVVLATCGDEFARKLLDESFPSDSDGQFIWPADGDEAGSGSKG